MAQHTYDNEAVQELLNWAKKMIETPTEIDLIEEAKADADAMMK